MLRALRGEALGSRFDSSPPMDMPLRPPFSLCSLLRPLRPSLAPSSLPQPLLHPSVLRLSQFLPFTQHCSPPTLFHLAPISFAARSMSGSPDSQIDELVKGKNSNNPVVVYSKSWCPYCGNVKALFSKLGVKPLIVELDDLVDELEVQRALERLTGQSTVPNVFIGGKHIGGCDDTIALYQKGELIPMLKAAGAKFS